jgi:uncharacterized membrane protein
MENGTHSQQEQQEEKRIRTYFFVSVFLKGLISAIEVIAGVVVLFVPITYFASLVLRYAQGELIENPNDFIATNLASLAHQFSIASSIFIALYLLSRGAIKLSLVVALFKNQLWAYPSSLVVLGLFVIYQIYQISATFSPLIIALTIFDFVVMWSIWREYRIMRTHHNLSFK